MKTRIILGVLALTGLAWGMSGARAGQEVPVVERGPTAVRVGAVEQTNAVAERRFSGWLTPARSGRLALTVGGRLQARPVKVGDSVTKGDLLGQVDRKPLRNRVRAATANLQRVKAQLRQAKRNRKRATTLEASGALATADAEDAGSAVEVLAAQQAAAEVDLAEARRVLGEATLRAPFDAVVTRVLFEPGEFVPAGQPVVELSGSDELELEVGVSEDLLGDLPVGHEVAVNLPRLHRAVTGRVAAVGRAAPERGELFPIRIDLEPGTELVAGLSAELVLPIGEPAGLERPRRGGDQPRRDAPCAVCRARGAWSTASTSTSTASTAAGPSSPRNSTPARRS